MYDSIICLLCGLIMPVTMIATGAFMWRFPAKYKGMGYHTERAESSPAAWAYAQNICARLVTLVHIPVLMLTIAAIIIGAAIKMSEDTAVALLLAMIVVQVIVLTAILCTVESKLRKRFDKNGNPR